MAKITLPELSGGFQSVALANANNDAIESALNNEVLYRNNPDGETNTMENLLDMNNNKIINVAAATAGGAAPAGSDLVTFADLQNLEDTINASPVLFNISNREIFNITNVSETTVGVAAAESYTRINSATQTDIVIELDVTASWLDSTEAHFRQVGAGLTRFITANGVVINVPFNGTLQFAGTGATVTIKKVGPDEWDLIGQTAVAS